MAHGLRAGSALSDRPDAIVAHAADMVIARGGFGPTGARVPPVRTREHFHEGQ